jgi:hypothetical protein
MGEAFFMGKSIKVTQKEIFLDQLGNLWVSFHASFFGEKMFYVWLIDQTFLSSSFLFPYSFIDPTSHVIIRQNLCPLILFPIIKQRDEYYSSFI